MIIRLFLEHTSGKNLQVFRGIPDSMQQQLKGFGKNFQIKVPANHDGPFRPRIKKVDLGQSLNNV